MKVCEVVLSSASPYSQSKPVSSPRLPKETPEDHEKRTWKERIHADESGQVYIPPMAFKNALSEIAKFLSIQIPGKGKSTYTKHFEAGILVLEPMMLGIQKDDVHGDPQYVPSDGVRGSGKRVWRTFPVIPSWCGKVTFHILDDTITEEVFERHLKEAGVFIGVGRFRPRNNGYYGRFSVKSTKWWEQS